MKLIIYLHRGNDKNEWCFITISPVYLYGVSAWAQGNITYIFCVLLTSLKSFNGTL